MLSPGFKLKGVALSRGLLFFVQQHKGQRDKATKEGVSPFVYNLPNRWKVKSYDNTSNQYNAHWTTKCTDGSTDGTKGLRVALWVISVLEIMYTHVMNTLLCIPASLECFSSLSTQTLLAPGSKYWGYTFFHHWLKQYCCGSNCSTANIILWILLDETCINYQYCLYPLSQKCDKRKYEFFLGMKIVSRKTPSSNCEGIKMI